MRRCLISQAKSGTMENLHFEYNSPRHFADLAVGLMKGAFALDETVEMERQDEVIDGHQVTLFNCRLVE